MVDPSARRSISAEDRNAIKDETIEFKLIGLSTVGSYSTEENARSTIKLLTRKRPTTIILMDHLERAIMLSSYLAWVPASINWRKKLVLKL